MSFLFVGANLALVGVASLRLLVMNFIRFPAHAPPVPGAAQGRPTGELLRQPVFAAAVIAAALSCGVMNLLMAATPIATRQCRHPSSSTAVVLEWRVPGVCWAQLRYWPPHRALGRAAHHVRRRPAQAGVRGDGAVGRGRDAVSAGIVCAGRGLARSLPWRQHAADPGLPARKEEPRGALWTRRCSGPSR